MLLGRGRDETMMRTHRDLKEMFRCGQRSIADQVLAADKDDVGADLEGFGDEIVETRLDPPAF